MVNDPHKPFGIKVVKVKDHHRAPDEPLAIDLSPGRLSPAGLRHGKVEPAVLGLLPVLGRDNMGQRIGKVMDHPFGLSRCPGGKVHNHRVGGQGGEPVQGVLGLLRWPG